MSLLGTPVYANASTPIWVSAAGGSGNTITAPLVVSKAGAGAIPSISPLYNIFSYGGEIVAQSNAATINPISFTLADASGNQKTRVLSTGGNSYIQSSEPLLFSQIGQGTANTSLQTSAPGTNADALILGGNIIQRGSGGAIKVQSGAAADLLTFGNNATAGASLILSTQPILFGQVGSGGVGANTSFLAGTPSGNADVLTVGGTVSARNLDLLDTTGAAVIGTATLTAGTVVVNTTACDVTSYIILTRTGVGASTTLGELRVSNQGANNFTVVSATTGSPSVTQTGDVSTFHWMIVNAA